VIRVTPLIVVAILTPILACSPVGYLKTGVTDEEYRRDIEECAELAQHQGRRDFATRRAHLPSFGRARRNVVGTRHVATLTSEAELEHRYRRVCMLARGYELAPLDE
jgi:hypothetical protein